MASMDYASDENIVSEAEDLLQDRKTASWLIPLLFLPVVLFVGWTIHDYLNNQGSTHVVDGMQYGNGGAP